MDFSKVKAVSTLGESYEFSFNYYPPQTHYPVTIPRHRQNSGGIWRRTVWNDKQ